MYVAVNGMWAKACQTIKVKVGTKWTVLWPMDLSGLPQQKTVLSPSCGPCLLGDKRVCSSKLSAGVCEFGEIIGMHLLFAHSANQQVVYDEKGKQLVVTADIQNSPLYLYNTKIWWAAPLGLLKCDQDLAKGTFGCGVPAAGTNGAPVDQGWLTNWKKYEAVGNVTAWVCGSVRLTIPVEQPGPCSTALRFDTSVLAFSKNTSVNIGQIRVDSYLIPAWLLGNLHDQLSDAILTYGVGGIPKNSLASLKTVTLPFPCPFCLASYSRPLRRLGSGIPLPASVLDTLFGSVVPKDANEAIVKRWPAAGVSIAIGKSGSIVMSAAPVLQSPIAFVPGDGNSFNTKTCTLDLQLVVEACLPSVIIDLVPKEEIDNLCLQLELTASAGIVGKSTYSDGGSLQIQLVSLVISKVSVTGSSPTNSPIVPLIASLLDVPAIAACISRDIELIFLQEPITITTVKVPVKTIPITIDCGTPSPKFLRALSS